jgi:hypothetical protein
LVAAAVIGLATFWLLSGMGFYLLGPVGDKPLIAVLFYTMMAIVILLPADGFFGEYECLSTEDVAALCEARAPAKRGSYKNRSV